MSLTIGNPQNEVNQMANKPNELKGSPCLSHMTIRDCRRHSKSVKPKSEHRSSFYPDLYGLFGLRGSQQINTYQSRTTTI